MSPRKKIHKQETFLTFDVILRLNEQNIKIIRSHWSNIFFDVPINVAESVNRRKKNCSKSDTKSKGIADVNIIPIKKVMTKRRWDSLWQYLSCSLIATQWKLWNPGKEHLQKTRYIDKLLSFYVFFFV